MVSPVSKPYQLLVADDDLRFRETICEILDPYFQLLEADSGEEAIEISETNRVDIALLDMHMRLLTGLETMRVLKNINALAPCILITADTSDDLERDATQADAFSVLAKPVTKEILVTTVSTALEEAYDDPDALSWEFITGA